MIIKASKMLIFINDYISSLLWFSLIFFIAKFLFPEYFLFSFSSMTTFIGIFGIAFIASIMQTQTLSNKFRIEVSEDGLSVGGMSNKIYLDNKHFISKESLDVERSLGRNFIRKFFGRYKIYDKEEAYFRLHKYYFHPKDFKKIQELFNDILGIQIS